MGIWAEWTETGKGEIGQSDDGGFGKAGQMQTFAVTRLLLQSV